MIRLSKQVYKKFLRFALENANPYGNRREWKEVIALVLGRIESESSVVVTDIVPVSSGTSVFVDITIGISEQNKVWYSVVPNPNDGDFALSFNEAVGGDVLVRINDIFGRLVYETKVVNTNTINVNGLPAGLYFVEISAGGIYEKQKIVVR